ncbi:hypothetical protein ACEPAH_2583 [Sanghuangporus vaninii]
MSKNKLQSTDGTSWFHRKVQLQTILGNCGDDEEEGIALDRLLHGQSVVGQTHKAADIDNVKFSDKDLTSFGPLAEAQFGTVELVSCRLDNRVYVRKRVSKKFALRNREQCSPQYEKHILLLALKSLSRSSSMWTPHMLCAYQCQSFLNIVMEYAAGGSLWDVLESSADGRLAGQDLEWWAPQCVSAIDWIHSRAGFVHRDIKPHNFVVRPGPSPRLLLIDFGSAAPLLKPDIDGIQRVQRSHCLVPCGTCDYISPEILRAHEEALVALEMSDEDCEGVHSDEEPKGQIESQNGKKILQGDLGYGRETDWWSLGAMLYELAFGIAPFFASDIRQTYARIVKHESYLSFDREIHAPPSLVSLIKGLLTRYENRLGRRSNAEIRNHIYFKDFNWFNLQSRSPPPGLLLPEFTYTTPLVPAELGDDNSEISDASKPFAFSALFQSSVTSKPDTSSFHHDPNSTPAFGRSSLPRSGPGGSAQRSLASFIGFSWGPPKDAFDDATRIVPAEPASFEPALCATVPTGTGTTIGQLPPVTPKRPSQGMVPPSTVRVTSVRRSAQSRPVSDREAMRVLVNCVGQSARRRVLESGKKPKVLLSHFGLDPLPPAISSASLRDSLGKARPRAPSFPRLSPKLFAAGGVRKELRFDETAPQVMSNLSYTNTFTTTLSNSAMSGGTIPFVPPPYSASDSGTMSELDGPPSPSPSPRPGSAMSMLSMSRRSATPTVSSGFLTAAGLPVRPSSEPPGERPRSRAGSLGSLITGGPRQTAEDDKVFDAPPRHARFADLDSPNSSPEQGTKDRLPATPHPKASSLDGEKDRTTRHAQFVDLSDSPPLDEPGKVKEHKRAPTTPHPRVGKYKTTTRAHFSDSVLSSPEPTRKVPMRSTPHPKGKENATRRGSRPPLQTRPMARMTSTPARPGARRSAAPFSPPNFSDDDETIRPDPPPSHRPDREDDENEDEVVTDGYVSDDPDDSLFAYVRCRNPSPPSFDDEEVNPDSFDYGGQYHRHRSYDDDDEPDIFGVMERRFKNLVSDIANLSLHIDDFGSRVDRVQR